MASSDSAVNKEEGFLSHLVELRDRLLKMLLSVGILFICLFWFSDKIYTALAAPLLRHLPDSQMIAIDVAAPFFIPFKLTLMLCVFLAVPYLLYQIWSFVAPGLYSHEKKLVAPLLISSTLLFYLGVAFAYFVVFPLVFGFFTSVAPEGVTVSTDIGRYLDFVITLFFAFGIAFEVPVATVLVVAVGITTPEQLVKIRPYVFVAAFIIGMFLTPPDMISQTLLAIPMWLLYEVGIVFSRKYKERIKDAGEAISKRYNDGDDDDPDPKPPKPDNSPGSGGAALAALTSTSATSADVVAKPSTNESANSADGHGDSGGATTANEKQDDGHAKPGFVDPALVEKPDEKGAYRNSLTDWEESADTASQDESEAECDAPSDAILKEDPYGGGLTDWQESDDSIPLDDPEQDHDLSTDSENKPDEAEK